MSFSYNPSFLLPALATLHSTASHVHVARTTWTQTTSEGSPVSYWMKPTMP